jgi:hypothetical protein
MRACFLGDSYDLVKRFWADRLGSLAPLYAHPKFIPPEIRVAYVRLTSMPVLDVERCPDQPFGIFLDPHTGIPLPSEVYRKPTRSHASLPFVLDVNRRLRPKYIVCFDQSYHRGHALKQHQQRKRKMTFLAQNGIYCTYYRSHAPFLFMAQERRTLEAIRKTLLECGMPAERLEPE